MGCGSSSVKVPKSTKPESVPTTLNMTYSISIKHPHTQQTLHFKYTDEYDEVPLTRLLNKFSFVTTANNNIKGNFVAFYNSETNLFEFYIDSLIGVDCNVQSAPHKGPQWTVTINDQKYTWNNIVHNDRRVTPHDTILLTYETTR